ncbi:MAG TPA: cytochrome c [Chitinophagaceae bacterium]|nr:cytochrome c [Chitinophagaceae bacterium]
MKRTTGIPLLALVVLLGIHCGNNPGQPVSQQAPAVRTKADTVVMLAGNNSKGVGRFSHIALTHPLDPKMVESGQRIYQSKCFACHLLSGEILVGPGWKDVTHRRTPEWIMNWITNTKVMLDKDQAAQADMVVCLIRMPNQDLTDEEAREVLEFMRKNDGEQ